MVKNHSYRERGNPLLPHGLLFPISSKGSFYMHHPTDRITHTTAFVTPVMEHWLEREIAQWVHPMNDRSDDPSHHERTLYLWAMSRSPGGKEGRKGMFYLTTHLTHFYLRVYGIRHMVKDHSNREKGNPLPPHRLFYMHHPTARITHTAAFVTPVVEHWLEREIAQWVHPMKDRSDDQSHHERTLLPRSYISLL